MSTTSETITEARIEADPALPIIRITRDFAATPEQLFRRVAPAPRHRGAARLDWGCMW